jgi:uncharacterized RDD family membrane protein YckC
MAKLIVNPTSPSRQEVMLPRTLLSIGRDPSNDLVLPDAMVSRRHAVIELRGNQYFLRDCNSSNGSLVNGDRVSERNLRDGDLVAIGTARLLFRDDVEVLDSIGKVVQHPSAPRLNCPQCGADYRRGDLFCKQCGGQLLSAQAKAICTSCGTAVPLPAKFCNACGGRLGPEGAEQPPGEAAGMSAPAANAPAAAEAPLPALAAEPPAAPVPAPPAAPVVIAPPAEGPAVAVARGDEKTVPPPRHRSAALSVGGASPLPEAPPLPRARVKAPPRPARDAAPRAVVERRDSPDASAAAAPLVTRAVAGLIDLLAVGLGQALLLAPAVYYWWPRQLDDSVSFVSILLTLMLVALALALGGLYFVYYWGIHGATPGKALLGLAVAGPSGELPIGVGRAAARLLGYLLSAAVLGAGFLLILVDGNGLHDRLAGTRVVRRERS